MARISASDDMDGNRKERLKLVRGTTSADRGCSVNSETSDPSNSTSKSSRSSLSASESDLKYDSSDSKQSPRAKIYKRKRSVDDSKGLGEIFGGRVQKFELPEGSDSSYSSQGIIHTDDDRRNPSSIPSRVVISEEKGRSQRHTGLPSSTSRPPRSHSNGSSPSRGGTTKRHAKARDDSISRKDRENRGRKVEKIKERSFSPETSKSSEQTRKVVSRNRSGTRRKRREASSDSDSEEDSRDSVRGKTRVEDTKKGSKQHTNRSSEQKSSHRKHKRSRRHAAEDSSDDSQSLASADEKEKKMNAKVKSSKRSRSEHTSEKGKDRKQKSGRGEGRKERSDRKKRRRKKSNVGSGESEGEESGGRRQGRDKNGAVRPAISQPLDAKMAEAEDAKEKLRRSAEDARKRLNSGEMQQARAEQEEMQRLYGTSDWRSKKKYRSEKRKLEKTVEAGNKLASLEARENERMDAFRIAMGLPSAEAQRQAQWREEASRALAQTAALAREADGGGMGAGRQKKGRIGPRLPK